MTVASNFLTGKTDTVNCTTDTAEPGTFVGNMKSKLNLSFANVWDLRTPRLDLRCVDLWELLLSFFVLQTKGQVLRTWCLSHIVIQYSIDQTGVKTTNEGIEAPEAYETFTLVPMLQDMRHINCLYII